MSKKTQTSTKSEPKGLVPELQFTYGSALFWSFIKHMGTIKLVSSSNPRGICKGDRTFSCLKLIDQVQLHLNRINTSLR